MEIKNELAPLKVKTKVNTNNKKALAEKIMETLMELKHDFKELKSVR